MILAHHGIKVEESALRERCKTTELGTFVEDLLACAREFGFMASIEYLSLDQLRALLGQGVYPIAYINMFPTSHIAYVHTVIVEAHKGGRLLVVDPNAEPHEIHEADFLESWAIHGNMAVVLRR